jgi:hypothetical protein
VTRHRVEHIARNLRDARDEAIRIDAHAAGLRRVVTGVARLPVEQRPDSVRGMQIVREYVGTLRDEATRPGALRMIEQACRHRSSTERRSPQDDTLSPGRRCRHPNRPCVF